MRMDHAGYLVKCAIFNSGAPMDRRRMKSVMADLARQHEARLAKRRPAAPARPAALARSTFMQRVPWGKVGKGALVAAALGALGYGGYQLFGGVRRGAEGLANERNRQLEEAGLKPIYGQ